MFSRLQKSECLGIGTNIFNEVILRKYIIVTFMLTLFYTFMSFFSYYFVSRLFPHSANKKNQCLNGYKLIKRPARDACLCMGDLQAPPAPHFVFLITL